MGTDAPKPADVGEWALLDSYLPGLPPQTIGILLRKVSDDSLHVRLRPHWWHGLLDEEESEIWSDLSVDLTQRAQEIGAAQVLDCLENTASHTIQISARQEIRLTQVEAILDALGRKYLGALDRSLERTNRRREQTVACLPKSGAHGCSRKRKRYLQVYSGWAQAAVAITILLGATLAGNWSKRPYSSILKQRPKLHEEIALPPFAALRYPPVLFNLDSGWMLHRPTRHFTKKRHRIFAHTRFQFRIQPRFIQFQNMEITYWESPGLQFAPDVSEGPLLPLSLPEAPSFRPRRNRFLRVLAVITNPFRLIISKHTPEDELLSAPGS